MENVANPHSTSPVTCKHCAALLQEGDRFCRFCGTDQTLPLIVAKAKWTGGRALAPIEVDFSDTIQPDQESIGNLVLTRAINDEESSEIGQVRPGAFWQQEVAGGGAPRHWAGSAAVPIRLVTAIVATLVVLAAALLFDHFYLDSESDAGRQREFKSNVAQVQSALSRGDLAAAERVLDELEVDHSDDPAVQSLRESFEQGLQAQADRREQLQNAAKKASSALGTAAPTAPAAPIPPAAPASVSQAPPKTDAPPRAISVADPKEKECNEALAALALCQR
ncbi:zinc ribbon domain-containing protein [Variovorax sp. GT1P44]|uniref:zinc ribbon domain-containing protein n=1 Tax=Variovorax sp. GT1P44 TaxID=3443742 RepID=UPI003F481B8C